MALGLESVLTREANQLLNTKDTSVNSQQVNHNVSFHAIKSEALNLLLSDIPIPIRIFYFLNGLNRLAFLGDFSDILP